MSNKRRKLDLGGEAAHISAFVARTRRVNNYAAKTAVEEPSKLHHNGGILVVPHSVPPEYNSLRDVSVERRYDFQDSTNPTNGTDEYDSPVFDPEEGDDSEESSTSRNATPLQERAPAVFSTFNASGNSIRDMGGCILKIYLASGERLVILGQYQIRVEQGQVNVLGYSLHASKTLHQVFALPSHALPVIRCAQTTVAPAVIQIIPHHSGLDELQFLSPLYSGLWKDGSTSEMCGDSVAKKDPKTSYRILLSAADIPRKTYVHPISSPPEWNELLFRMSGPDRHKAPTVLICGPKNAGKSTFAKLLTNRLLASSSGGSCGMRGLREEEAGVAYLDLDPGQPEYSTPGQLSLSYVQEPDFGPSYTHPVANGNIRLLKAHALGTLSPATNLDLYMSCALDLFEHFRAFLSLVPNCPLVINTPGWILGTGLEILLKLIQKTHPTDVVYMSFEGPDEVVLSIQKTAGIIPFHTLPSQISDYMTRTSSQLRTLQYMSYFHIEMPSAKSLTWSGRLPLTSIPPLEIRYSGNEPGILGIMCYGEQPPAELLLDTINGSLLSIVILDDMAAIPGWNTQVQEGHQNGEDENSCRRSSGDDWYSRQALEQPPIVRTPREDIPYFNPANAIVIDPRYSHTIGLLLVRGIDIHRRRLQVLTPLPLQQIDEVFNAKKSIVLVSGKLDTPGWAYTENSTLKAHLGKAQKKGGDEVMLTDKPEESSRITVQEHVEDVAGAQIEPLASQEIPWVEELSGSQAREQGAKVWRVRRDLGKSRNGH